VYVNKVVYVCSYGGCASKAFCSWVSQSGHYSNYHIHSRIPPNKLCIADSERFIYEQEVLDPENYYVVYIFRNPVESFLSRFCPGVGHHSANIDVYGYLLNEHNMSSEQYEALLSRPTLTNDSKSVPITWITNYIEHGIDLWGYGNFFDNYVNQNINTNYPIYAINYHKMWDDKDAICDALDINKAVPFFERTEKVTSHITTALDDRVGCLGQISEDLLDKLNKIYEPLNDKINQMPSITIVEPQ